MRAEQQIHCAVVQHLRARAQRAALKILLRRLSGRRTRRAGILSDLVRNGNGPLDDRRRRNTEDRARPAMSRQALSLVGNLESAGANDLRDIRS